MAEHVDIARRRFLTVSAGATTTLALAGWPARGARAQGGAGRALKLGYVSPQTGPLAGFGEADNFVVAGVRKALGKGLVIRDRTHPIEILVRDSQSDPNRAAEVASRLILTDKIDLMLVASTPETTNPVADQCEANGTPCVSTMCPWQPWFFGRGGKPETGFKWTYHYFWGLEDIIGVFSDMWGQVENNQVLGGLWPDDGDGRAWSSGFPAALEPQGYRIVDPGRYQDEKDSFRFEVQRFKDAGADIVTGVPLPPDFATFWKQAGQLGYRPRVATVGKALLFPAFIEAMGSAEGVSTEVWWSPSHPFRSSLTGASAGELAQEYTRATGRQWTQPIGFVHALFEVAADVLRRAGDVSDRQALVDAIKATSLNTIVGRVSWAKSQADFPNVARTPLVGGQWRRGRTWPFELEIVSNATHPEIPASGTLQPIA